MVKAFVFVRAEPNKVDKVGLSLIELRGIKEVYAIAGEYDLVVKIEAEDFSQVSKLVKNRILSTDGVVHTTTALVFEEYRSN